MATATVDGGDELRSAARARESRGGGEGTRESERVRGGVSRGIQTRRGEGRQAEREVAWCGGARARRARTRPPVGEEDDRGGGQVGWAGQLGRPGRTVLLGCTGRRPR